MSLYVYVYAIHQIITNTDMEKKLRTTNNIYTIGIVWLINALPNININYYILIIIARNCMS